MEETDESMDINEVINILNTMKNFQKDNSEIEENIIQEEESKSITEEINYNDQLADCKKPKFRYLKFKALEGDSLINSTKPKESGYHYLFPNGDVKLVKCVLEENGFTYTNRNDWAIVWNIGSLPTGFYHTLSPFQKVNHFPKSVEITRKDFMYRNIVKMQEIYGVKNFNIVPKTFILPSDYNMLYDVIMKIKKGLQKA